MTKTDALEITRQADDLAEIHPTHAIAGDLRAAAAAERHANRKARERTRDPLALGSFEAAFAAAFGDR